MVIHLLRASMKMRFWMYLETLRHSESKECLANVCATQDTVYHIVFFSYNFP